MALLYDTYFTVALSFVIFVGLMWKYDVHGMLLRSLDARAERIRGELEDAKRLREEAQALLASYERKHKEVEETSAAIVARAKEEATMAAEQAQKDLAASIERRLKGATDQIAAAEAAAMREVKDRAVSVAVAAAAEVIARSMTKKTAAQRIDASIAEVAQRLN